MLARAGGREWGVSVQLGKKEMTPEMDGGDGCRAV